MTDHSSVLYNAQTQRLILVFPWTLLGAASEARQFIRVLTPEQPRALNPLDIGSQAFRLILCRKLGAIADGTDLAL
jgi:hypothetical protein